ncbi:hypothetical protein H9Q09_21630 [Aurantimonas sp. DM33-3]|uniref:hypothetical protein n=1 Tax=Aurantimonas sp. DM33-3 TaxID=2766955 RepID=UPI0016527854|nr:hypothetical protein [Aurantimonas sp. DM33-3]MBC6718783.1 hypothetical protein [Aurantimonas sp. DM33-3]
MDENPTDDFLQEAREAMYDILAESYEVEPHLDHIEKLAFDIPAPNPHTPKIVEAVIGARSALTRHSEYSGTVAGFVIMSPYHEHAACYHTFSLTLAEAWSRHLGPHAYELSTNERLERIRQWLDEGWSPRKATMTIRES